MTVLKFTDGVSVDTSGPVRTLHLEDGWYAVGEGMLIPCADQQEAEDEVRLTALRRVSVRYPNVTVKLVGRDGNAFNILGLVMRAMRKAGVTPEEIKTFQTEATSGNYDHLLQTCVRCVEVT